MTFFLVWYQLVEQLHFLIKHESFNIVSSKHQDPLNTDFQNVTYFIHKDRGYRKTTVMNTRTSFPNYLKDE